MREHFLLAKPLAWVFVASLLVSGCLVRGHQFDGNYNFQEHSKVSRALRRPEILIEVRETAPNRSEYALVERDSPDVTALEVLERIEPDYPLVMAMLGENGHVKLNFVVTSAGRAESIQVVEASNTLFAKAATRSLRNWTFLPAQRAGLPVSIVATTTFDFERPWEAANSALEGLIFDLVVNRDYETLELLAERYRKNRDKLPDGRWRLERFYEVAIRGLRADSNEWRNCKPVNQSLLEWSAFQPESATAIVIRAGFLLDCAWAIRGKGTTDQVDDNAWAPFFSYVKQAIDTLESGRSIAEKDPHFHALQIKALGAHERRNEFSRSVREGLAFAPDYLAIHRSAVNYLLPKWGGSQAGTLAFINRSERLTAHEFGNAFVALDFYIAVHAEFEDVFLNLARENWEQIRDGITTWIALFPAVENAEKFAYLSCRVGDVSTLAILLQMLGDTPADMEIWRSRKFYNTCVDVGNLLDLDDSLKLLAPDMET